MSARRSADSSGGDKKRFAKEDGRNTCEKQSVIEVRQESENPKREVEKIIGVTDDNGELEFGIKFKGHDSMELIPARVANLEYPQQIIAYYEERLVWESRDGTTAKATPQNKRNHPSP